MPDDGVGAVYLFPRSSRSHDLVNGSLLRRREDVKQMKTVELESQKEKGKVEIEKT